MWILYAILSLAAIYLFAIIYPYLYWKKRGVPYKIYFPYIDGLYAMLLKQIDLAGFLNKGLYDHFLECRYFGALLFGAPTIVIKDCELIKEMFIKNFDHFVDRLGFADFENEPLWSKNLLNLKGQAWKEMRSTLSPSFTGSQMKNLFLLIDECTKNYVDVFSNEPDNIVELELKDLFKRFSIDVIANTAYGIQINSLKDKNNDFFMYGRNINEFGGFWNVMKLTFIKLFPRLSTLLDVHFINPKYSNYFSNVIKSSIEYRKKHNIQRNDMIQLLLNAKQRKDESIDENDIISQAFLFFGGGTDTVSASMYFLAYELAVNPDVQEKLRQEIEDSKTKNEPSYELIMNLPYLDMVITESLRKSSIFFVTSRVCTKPYQIKPTNSNEKPFDINVGDQIWIPLGSLHMDAKYFPNPEKFDPERFSSKDFKNTAPYFPFGFGPRTCIAYRFVLMEMKTFFFHMISDFEIVPTKKSVIPFTRLKGAMKIESAEDLWFGFKKRKI